MKRRLQKELEQTRPFPTLEEEVYLELQRTAQVAARWITLALKPSGLSESQFNVLRILRGCHPDGLPSTRIAERMVRHDPDLTRLLDRLVASGLVEKTRDTRDRRVVTARITTAGLQAVERASDFARQTIVEALSPFGARRLAALADLLELARRGVESDRASRPGTRPPAPGRRKTRPKAERRKRPPRRRARGTSS